MKILFVANTPPDPDTGASGCDLATIAALQELGHDVEAVWRDDLTHRIAHPNLHNLLELPRSYSKVVEERVSASAFDVIQINQPHAYLAARAHQRMRRPGIFVNRSHGWEEFCRQVLIEADARIDARPFWRRQISNGLWQLIRRHGAAVTKYSDGMVVGSERDRDFLMATHGVPPHRVISLTPGVDEQYLQAAPPSHDTTRCLRLLHVGQFTPFKAPDAVARIASQVLVSNEKAQMTWVCAKQHHPQALSLVRPEVRGRVRMVAWMRREDLRNEFDRHGIFLFPSKYEGFGMAFLEAMARGMCVVASRTGGMAQTIDHEVNGFLFEVGADREMAEMILTLMSNPQRVAKVSQAAVESVQRLTWGRAAKELSEFYESLLRLKSGIQAPT